MKFHPRNYNEFKNVWFRFHDYISISINEFPIVLIRRYDWFDLNLCTYIFCFLGFQHKKQVRKQFTTPIDYIDFDEPPIRNY